jgi:dTDP-4-dehydrorhamnose 3,5-epimerase
VFGDSTRLLHGDPSTGATFREAVGADVDPAVQDNHSRSAKGVLRGLHYQIQRPQGKLVRVVAGRVFDVAVDIRKSSPTFGRVACVELSEENHRQFWVPPGLAHGFLVLSEVADFLYKTTDYWVPAHERLRAFWNDPDAFGPVASCRRAAAFGEGSRGGPLRRRCAFRLGGKVPTEREEHARRPRLRPFPPDEERRPRRESARSR